MTNVPAPHPGCYWVVPGKILAGNYPGEKNPAAARKKLSGILDAGVRCFINLMERNESNHAGKPFSPYKDLADGLAVERGFTLKHRRFPIVDQKTPDPKQMHDILDCIDFTVGQDLPIYIHCWGGHGRTGMAVGCYLIEQGLATADTFVDEIARLRKDVDTAIPSPENNRQRKFVKGFNRSPFHREPEDAEEADRYRGCLMGLAVGDAVGTALEFKAPGTFVPIEDMVGGGPFSLNPGEWTDDTTMALCLAESLIEKQRFDAVDQLQRYCRWRKDGYLSAKGYCFDIGGTTASALRKFESTGEPWCGSTSPNSAGNGSLMRLAPIPMAFADKPKDVIHNAADSSRTTHGALEAVDACRYYAGILLGALRGESKETLLSPFYCPEDGGWEKQPLAPKIHAIASGSFKAKEPPEIQGNGYVVLALEAALWAFYKTDNFRDGCLLAANLGDDADTTAAIYGQVAGACYGAASIPIDWREKLYKKELIEDYAMRLYWMSHQESKTHFVAK